jgi:hypothetical protein
MRHIISKKPSAPCFMRARAPRAGSPFAALLLALVLRLVMPLKLQAQENKVEYRFENYSEQPGRMQVQTHMALFDIAAGKHLSLAGSLIYDGISGASPIGAPPPPGSSEAPLSSVPIVDIRRAFQFAPSIKWENHTITPQIAVSKESDYESVSPALNYSIDFNDKNTRLNLGVSHDFDTINAFHVWGPDRVEHKDTTDFLIGINQLLSKDTVLTLNVSAGYSRGYLADPYKGAFFSIDYLNLGSYGATIEEKRPHTRFKEVALLELTQNIGPLRASVEPSYRLYHDDFGIVAHTLALTYWQRLGTHLRIGPTFRYYRQSQADFYQTQFAGDPNLPEGGSPAPGFEPVIAPAHPEHYSSDYRLSSLTSLTYGVDIHWQVIDALSIELGYKRYEMSGNDDATSASVYPRAHIFTAGLAVWF